MVRVNGQASAAALMNVYPGIHPSVHVLHFYVEAPLSEEAIWLAEELLNIEADWKDELGGMVFASQAGLTEILQHCSAQGQFSAKFYAKPNEGILAVHLSSVGSLKPLEGSYISQKPP